MGAEKLTPSQKIEVWRVYCEECRHFDSIYWESARSYSLLTSLLVGGAGAVLSFANLQQSRWIQAAIASAFLILAAGVSYLGQKVVEKQGYLIELPLRKRNEYEEDLGVERSAPERSDLHKVRETVERTFQVSSVLWIVGATAIILGWKCWTG